MRLVILALTVLACVCGIRCLNPDFLDQLERMTYDWRVRAAQRFPAPVASNLAFVSMEDSSISAIRHGLLGRPYGLYWPRHIYGRVIEELSAQGAKTIAFDVLFGELRPDQAAGGDGRRQLDRIRSGENHGRRLRRPQPFGYNSQLSRQRRGQCAP